MTDTDILRKKINKKGYKLKYVAKNLGLTYYGLKLKIENVSQFKADEITELCKLLGIETLEEKESIFFKN